MKNNYAFIKNNEVINIVVFEDETEELLNHFKETFELDDIVFSENRASIGGLYIKEKDVFVGIKPFNSWILNEDTYKWEAPVSYPEDDNNYTWNESTLSWDLTE
jgi:hypothetical protein